MIVFGVVLFINYYFYLNFLNVIIIYVFIMGFLGGFYCKVILNWYYILLRGFFWNKKEMMEEYFCLIKREKVGVEGKREFGSDLRGRLKLGGYVGNWLW